MKALTGGQKCIAAGVAVFAFGFGLFLASCTADVVPDEFDKLVGLIKGEEDFSATVYKDSLGYDTIGFGINISEGITEAEGELLLRERLKKAEAGIAKAWKPFKSQTLKIRSALADMSYQLGVHGVLEFKDMLSALAVKDYRKAAEAAENSKWFTETPARAKRVISIIRSHI